MVKSGENRKQVIIDWGYPVISKSVAMKLSRYIRTKSDEQKDKRLNGYIGRNGKLINSGAIPKKYKELIYAPFELSEKCCEKIKHGPLNKLELKEKIFPITGEIAEESRDRKLNYLKNGCIRKTGRMKCTPLGFWTKQDILQCIKKYNIEVSDLYGEVIQEGKEFRFSKEQRTGCDICGFGILYDLDRLVRLKKRNKKLFDYMMDGGEWIQKDISRPMRFYYGGKIENTNWYWVPSKEGFGYRFVLEYILLELGYELSYERHKELFY